MQFGLIGVELQHGGGCLRLVRSQIAGAGLRRQPQVARQRLVLGQVVSLAVQLLAGQDDVFFQCGNVCAAGLQVDAV